MNFWNLYIDPGAGSMLFTILIGVITAGFYLFRKAFSKLLFLVTGGAKADKKQKDRIPFVIFTDSKRYWSLFEPICDVFEQREQPLCYLTASPDDPALQKEYQYVTCRFIGEGNKAFGSLNYLKADMVLSTTPGLDVLQWKRSRDVGYYVHVLHAPSDVAMYRMFGVDYYDAVLLSGEYQKKQLRELEAKRHLPAKELLMGGLPSLDAMQKRLAQADPLPEHPVTVLLAPSWGKSSIFGRYGGRMIEALQKTGYHIIIRPHPQSFVSEKELMDQLMAAYPPDDHLEWNRDNDNFEVLRRADLLISDFSGVIFEYALVFQKPVIYADTSYDKSPYDACWLEEELWTFTTLPKIGKQLTEEDMSDMKQAVDSVLHDSTYQDGIRTAREETWALQGQAAEAIADYLIDKRSTLLSEQAAAKAAKEAEEQTKKAQKKKKRKKNISPA